MDKISERIIKLMSDQSVTEGDISTALHVPNTRVKRWLSGDARKMNRSEIITLSSLLNVSPAYLMGWEDFKGYVLTINGENEMKVMNTTKSEAIEMYMKVLLEKGIMKIVGTD